MAITKAARSKIFTLVQEIKKLLVLEVASQLQQFYGIRPDGSMLLVEQLPATEPEILHTARLLRQRIDYIKSNIPSEKNKEVEAIKQLLNEQAFSILNRFATLRMAEERGIIKETIRKEYNSEGFQIFDSITGQGAVAEQYIRYKWYLHSIFDELAIDLPSVFDRFSPYALVFPGEKTMRSLLTIINNEVVTMHREEGKQPMNLWQEDETIGWIYQYYNSREEISEMRDESSAPRNSRELAVRNQFFTPRYVVQFLTDNSLGRIWYEMTKGKTELIHKCQYLTRRPKEMFLDKGNTRPDNADEETDYIEHREIKDPREILMLDPACGSMHFGLYSFDLFEQIYTEAWDNHPELMLDLRNTITRKQYINQIPEFIIRYNIHGVDIDPRALQIAALSLWLRAQKSFEKLNLEPVERPQITKSNLVLAEAMPGNAELLSALVKPLDAPLRKLVTAIWDLMKMAGETGLLLRIEEEIDRNINEIAADLSKDAKDSQLELGADERTMKAAERAAFYSTKKYRDSFLENAASEVFRILKELSETATNGEAYQKLLFADDAARGFAFIELCRKRYDVVLMNPPFGVGVRNNFEKLKKDYPDSYVDLLAAFVSRANEICNGFTGVISSRSILVIPKLQKLRERLLIPSLTTVLDLGGPVMDNATVQAAAYILNNSGFSISKNIFAIDKKGTLVKSESLIEQCKNEVFDNVFLCDRKTLSKSPKGKILYNLPKEILDLFGSKKNFASEAGLAKQGMSTFDDLRFVRLRSEVLHTKIGKNKKWRNYSKGGEFALFYSELPVIVNYEFDGKEVQEVNRQINNTTAQARQASIYYYRRGGTYTIRSKDFGVRVLPDDYMIGQKGPAILTLNESDSPLFIIGLLNSSFYNFLINLQANDRQFTVGIIETLPFHKFSKSNIESIESSVQEIILALQYYYSFNEMSSRFIAIGTNNNLNEMTIEYNSIVYSSREKLKRGLGIINNIVDLEFKIDSSLLQNILRDSGDESEGEEEFKYKTEDTPEFDSHINFEQLLPLHTNLDSSKNVLSYLVGLAFDRYKKEKLTTSHSIFSKDEIFKNYTSIIPALNYESTLVPFYESFSDSYLKSNNLIQRKIEELINEIWKSNGSQFLMDILDAISYNNLSDYFNSPNGFFNDHLKKYSESRREAPIYWPISTSTGSYTVWLYYPKLTDQTLVSVINNYLQPKIDDVKSQIKPLEINSNLDNKGLKELAALKDFEHELEEMKKELLRITALPYKPNHDDGVLITAAPLHNLFRHTKWRKSTEDCWKALEKGEYDWAHLAYSIWPDRVTKKCKKDLSMAIAHGLENICEIKPKEKKAKTTKPAKKGSVNPQLNFEE